MGNKGATPRASVSETRNPAPTAEKPAAKPQEAKSAPTPTYAHNSAPKSLGATAIQPPPPPLFKPINDGKSSRPAVDSAAEDYMRLLTNNREFVEEMLKQDPSYFMRLSKGQKPNYMLIGCSDSRVPPDRLTLTNPGEMFIHRNVANLVVNTDINLLSVLQYAVEVLKVQHVIVMGHYLCGGVRAAMTNEPHGLIDQWLRNIKDVYRLHKHELDNTKNDDERFDRLVELNVMEAAYNMYKTGIIQQAWATGHFVQVHGWVCDIRTGLINDLHVEDCADWEEIEHIYELRFPTGAPIPGMDAKKERPPIRQISEHSVFESLTNGPLGDEYDYTASPVPQDKVSQAEIDEAAAHPLGYIRNHTSNMLKGTFTKEDFAQFNQWALSVATQMHHDHGDHSHHDPSHHDPIPSHLEHSHHSQRPSHLHGGHRQLSHDFGNIKADDASSRAYSFHSPVETPIRTPVNMPPPKDQIWLDHPDSVGLQRPTSK